MTKFLRRKITQLGNAAEDFGNIVTTGRQETDQTELSEVISHSTDPIPSLHTSFIETVDNRCKNSDDLFTYMETTDIMNKLKDSENVLLLKIQVSEYLRELSEDKLNELCEMCQRKSIVILLTIRSEFKCIIYWKSNFIRHFYTIKHYKDEFLWVDREVYCFIAEFLGESLKNGELGISKMPSPIVRSTIQKDRKKHKTIDINDLTDVNNYNILLQASIKGNADVVETLIQIGMSTEFEDTNAQTLAWQNRHSDVLLALAQADIPFPDGIDINQLSDTFKRFYSMIEEFHAAIEARNETKVKKIITQNKNLKNFYNLSNVTAAYKALECKAFNIYEILIANDIFPLDHENKILKNFPRNEQQKIREIHTKYSRNLRDKHINILMAHSYLSYHAKNEEEKLKLVRKAYETLSKDERIDIVLQVVSMSNKLKIIYDFNSESVDTVDPTATEYTEGNFYLSGRIYIGAKQLLKNETKSKTLSTMAHELCHYAMDLVYRHKAKPYLHGDRGAQKEFKKVYKECEKNASCERFIELVYDSYRIDVQHAELIVRVPHLIALYQNQPEKLNEVMCSFPKLFDFYEKRSKVDMMKFLDGKVLEIKKSFFESKIGRLIALLLIVLIVSVIGIFCYGTFIDETFFEKLKGFYSNLTQTEENGTTTSVPEIKTINTILSTNHTSTSTPSTTEYTSSSTISSIMTDVDLTDDTTYWSPEEESILSTTQIILEIN